MAGDDFRKIWVNGVISFVDHDGSRVVFCRHEPIYTIALADIVHLRMVAAALRHHGLATQEEIAGAFGHSVNTQRRWEQRYAAEGAAGLIDRRRPGRSSTLDCSEEDLVRRWFRKGVSNRKMAAALGVNEATIRRCLKRLGLRREPQEVQGEMLPEEKSEEAEATADTPAPEDEQPAVNEGGADATTPGDADVSEEEAEVAVVSQDADEVTEGGEVPAAEEVIPLTVDSNPTDRSGDRALARLGLLEDAVPLFADSERLPRAGVLLAVPLLVRHGLLGGFRQTYGRLGAAFYGLRTVVVVLFLCALLRIKRPEHFKEFDPVALGRIVGLDRVPEVKTVRRKLEELAAFGKGSELMEALMGLRIEEDPERVGFLYLDGHVREYRGKHHLPKAQKAQRGRAVPATTDTWVHDGGGEPLLVVTGEMNEGLTQVLEPILRDVRRLVGEARRPTVIFDRGGYSPKLFVRLTELGFDILTYRKGTLRPLPASRFRKATMVIEGQTREYTVCDRRRVRVGRLRRKKQGRPQEPQYLWMREVRVLRKDGRQTAILATREDLPAVEVAYRMFDRWRQENYFKYMAVEFDLDGLLEYGAEPVSAEVDRPNPQWKRWDEKLRQERNEVKRLQAELGRCAAGNTESARPTMRGFKIAHAEVRRQLQAAEAKVKRLEAKRAQVPKRVSAADLQKLKGEKKLIMDVIRMAAYQVETDLVEMLSKHYARTHEEGRTFLHAVFRSPADVAVRKGVLHITIAPQSSPHRTAALAILCDEVNSLGATFPGTSLRLQFAAADHPKERQQPPISRAG